MKSDSDTPLHEAPRDDRDGPHIKRVQGMYDVFDRSGTPSRATHYCAGCGHGLAHKLIMEAVVELGLQDRTVMVNPIGCAVFGYYYWDVGNIGAAHGRAPAIATAISRGRPGTVVISYQGDGDLAAIGFNQAFQAASRGERMVTFFINNATYGMTGGQMAPTTLPGQKTATSPRGRTLANDGYPVHVCEVFNTLPAPLFIARCSLADTARIMQARRAIRRALELQRDGKGYALVELLSPCPTNIGGDSAAAVRFVNEQLEAEFPLAAFRDRGNEAPPPPPRPPRGDLNAYFSEGETATAAPADGAAPEELRLKFGGAGGQGVLSLGLCVAEAGRYAGRCATWFPTYGPEQRGGAAACSVVLAGASVGSPVVDKPQVLVCLNEPALRRYAPELAPGGTLIYEAAVPAAALPELPAAVRVLAVPAAALVAQQGMPKAANTLMFAALVWSGVTGLTQAAALAAIAASLRRKPALIARNREVFEAGIAWCEKNLAR
ncbi:MAG: 2-oxoacid:acceptor oxidoreductase family protein [Kiritimatiellae bacterium]|nr:2-oxoacid:acceptor oxidoreductase family protein [Kiritimatiellia bacterium]